MSPFTDHFSKLAASYAAFRPAQPAAVIAYAASLPSRRDVAWDCGTGNGQAARGLAEYFGNVVATDASAAQIAHAVPHSKVRYLVAPAEESGLPDHSVDLVTVAQALHWFDLERFYREVARVVAPGGAIAVWGYGDARSDDAAVDHVLRDFTRGTLGPFWPPERRILDEGFRTIPFPFREVTAPNFTLEEQWTLPELLGYLRTWSAAGAYTRATGRDAVEEWTAAFTTAWHDEAIRRVIRWPIAIRVGFVG
jgi:SAM-dependent methyltransferase